MRAPKFRAWDIHKKKMFTNDQLIIWNGNVYANDNFKLNVDNLKGWNIDEKYLMQSTGLKDKNGKEIFEGDIINYKYSRHTSTQFVVKYNEFQATFVVVDNHNDLVYTFRELADYIQLNSLEVIGNIYENKELLGGK